MRFALLALAGLVVAAAPPRVELKVGEVVPDIAFKAYDGKDYRLSDFRANAEKKTEGQVVVVYFQSEACPFQIDPEVLKKVVEPWNDGKEGVKVITFFSDRKDTEKRIEAYIEKHKLPYTCAWDEEKKLKDHFGAKKVNTTYVLDKTGKLVYWGGFAVMKNTKEMEKATVVDAVKAAKEGTAAPKSGGKVVG
ncbi:MAG TPA: redoxin domain-containing protein [Planctomycetota bacterium]|nr:redoxin domain-containing protein [Planctomycetota bacterium]